MVADEFYGALVEQVREVAFALHRLESFAQDRRAVKIDVAVVVGVAGKHPEIFVEAPPRGVVFIAVTKMPFPENARRIPRVF